MGRFVQLDGVSFAYPGTSDLLFADVDAFFPEGGWTGVVGANGCGKTTLLKLVSHDARFLARLARTQWRLEPTARGTRLVVDRC